MNSICNLNKSGSESGSVPDPEHYITALKKESYFFFIDIFFILCQKETSHLIIIVVS